MYTVKIDSECNTMMTRNLSGDEIANVNFLYDDIVLYIYYKI